MVVGGHWSRTADRLRRGTGSGQSAFASGGKLAGGKNVLYFVSDGKPQDGDNSVGIVEEPAIRR